jgi:hypothetical protein
MFQNRKSFWIVLVTAVALPLAWLSVRPSDGSMIPSSPIRVEPGEPFPKFGGAAPDRLEICIEEEGRPPAPPEPPPKSGFYGQSAIQILPK